MFNLRHLICSITSIAAVVLLCITATPDAYANNNGASVTPAQNTEASIGSNGAQDKKHTQTKAAQKPGQKSIFDADVLERPLSYFRNSLSSDEDKDDDDMLSYGNTVIIAIKALLASLLSTII